MKRPVYFIKPEGEIVDQLRLAFKYTISMFFVVGMLATAAIVGLVGTRKVGWRILFAAVGIGVICVIGTSDLVTTRGADVWWEQPLWRNLILYVAMFLGMMFRVVQDQMDVWRESNAKPRAWRRRRRPRFDFWDFVYPVIPSLALFQAVLGAAGQNELSLSLFLASFQNGFFWHALLAKTKQQSEAAAGAKA